MCLNDSRYHIIQMLEFSCCFHSVKAFQGELGKIEGNLKYFYD